MKHKRSVRKAQSLSRRKPSSYAGSIADGLERSPGGIEGALARIKAAKATGRPMTSLQLFEIAVSEGLLS